jgi:hypothetical protein
MPSVIAYSRTRRLLASQCGVPLDGSFSDPTTGSDATTTLQAVLDTAQTDGPLDLTIDGIARVHDLKLYSGTTLRSYGGSYWSENANYNATDLPTSGLIHIGTGSSSETVCAIRNGNWRSPASAIDGSGHATASVGTASVPDWSRILDQDITVKDLFILGNRGTTASKPAQGSTDTHGRVNATASAEYIRPVSFFGVTNLQLDNVFVYDPSSFAFHLAYVDGARITNCGMCDPTRLVTGDGGTNRNTDGFHLNGPCQYIVVDGFQGACGDDFIAVNADDGNMLDGTGAQSTWSLQGVGPQAFGSHLQVYQGPILDCTFKNLRLRRGPDFFRILSGTSRIHRIAFERVSGTATNYLAEWATFITLGGGNVGDIILRDWQIEMISPANNGINMGLVTDSITLDGFQARGTGTMQALYIVKVGADSLGCATFNNCLVGHFRGLLSNTSGAVSSVICSNTRHTQKDGGNASIATAGTIPVIAGAGNIGVTTSGTFTDATKFGSA